VGVKPSQRPLAQPGCRGSLARSAQGCCWALALDWSSRQRSQPGVPLASSVSAGVSCCFTPACTLLLQLLFRYRRHVFMFCIARNRGGAPYLLQKVTSLRSGSIEALVGVPRGTPGYPFGWLLPLLPARASSAVLNIWGLCRQGSPLPLRRRDPAALHVS